jgi:hypothetical protein
MIHARLPGRLRIITGQWAAVNVLLLHRNQWQSW